MPPLICVKLTNMPEKQIFVQKPQKGEAWDTIIIGSGPAALTAAIYTTRGAASTLIIGGDSWGGQLMLTTTVDNFPGFPEGIEGPGLMNRMRSQAERFGAEFIAEDATEVIFDKKPFEVKTGSKSFLGKSVILATGAVTKWLGIPGEDRLRGRGISSCAPCDAPFFKDKKVVVVGGGDSAMEEAIVLTKYASQVYLVHRRDEFRASQAMQQRVKTNEKISIIWNTEVTEAQGGQMLERLRLKTSKKQDNFEEIYQKAEGQNITEENGQFFWDMPVGGMFVAIGHKPATEIFKGRIELDEKDYIKPLPKDGFNTSTNVEGVFVSGDVHDTTYRQAITAAGFGCMAGMEVLKYLDKDTPSW